MTKVDSSLETMRKILSRAPQPLPGDFLYSFEESQSLAKHQDAAHALLRKRVSTDADGNPLRYPEIDVRALNKMLANGSLSRLVGRVRKTSLPPQSSNAASGGSVANTGASNSWKDQIAPATKPARVGGQVTTDISHSPNIDAVLDAIKTDLSRGAKRIGV